MRRQTALTAKLLSTAERKALVAKVAETASAKARAGIALIDFREPTAKERAIAASLERRERKITAAGRQVA